MARIRSIKPEFWSSEQVMECDPLARLMFIGLWNFCDDYGRLPASLKQIKALVFPGDAFDSRDIGRMLDELAGVGLIEFYRVADKDYLRVTGWARHQKVEKACERFPAPPQPNDSNAGPLFADHSATARRPVVEHSPAESSRVESKGEEIDTTGTRPARAGECEREGVAQPADRLLEVECRAKVDGMPASVAVNFVPILRLIDQGMTREDVIVGIDEALAKGIVPRGWSVFENFIREAAKNRMERAQPPPLRVVNGGFARGSPGPAGKTDLWVDAARNRYARAIAREESDASSG